MGPNRCRFVDVLYQCRSHVGRISRKQVQNPVYPNRTGEDLLYGLVAFRKGRVESRAGVAAVSPPVHDGGAQFEEMC